MIDLEKIENTNWDMIGGYNVISTMLNRGPIERRNITRVKGTYPEYISFAASPMSLWSPYFLPYALMTSCKFSSPHRYRISRIPFPEAGDICLGIHSGFLVLC